MESTVYVCMCGGGGVGGVDTYCGQLLQTEQEVFGFMGKLGSWALPHNRIDSHWNMAPDCHESKEPMEKPS